MLFKVLLLIFLINYYTYAAIPGCFESSTGCYTYCSKIMGTCSSPFREITEKGSNDGNICYCYRPYTEEEINLMNAGECTRYSNQCFSLSLASTSCANALKICDNDKKKELCIKGKELKVQNNLAYYCIKRRIMKIEDYN